MARKDDLDQLIDEFAEEDAALPLRVAAALERRELARQLAERRRDAGLTQAELAERMGTSQGQITRFESGADTRLSTVARYAAAIGIKLHWSMQPLDHTRKHGTKVSRQRLTRGTKSSPPRARQRA
jgi:ribosome-binding protein aMBF1 (putative translation factor)